MGWRVARRQRSYQRDAPDHAREACDHRTNPEKSLDFGKLSESLILKTLSTQSRFSSDVLSLLQNYFSVPQTPLPSLERLKEERDNWVDFQNAYGQTLNEMRVNYDPKLKIKDISDSNNPLIIRRMKKTKTGEPAATASPTTSETAAANTTESSQAATTAAAASSSKQSKVPEGGLVVEDLTRESSMISVDGNTPTNSRPGSPKRMVQ